MKPIFINTEMQIDYFTYLPETFRIAAADLYFQSLIEKLGPILGNDGRGQDLLAGSINTDNCIIAVGGEKLVGIMGIQTRQGGFVNPTLRNMVKIYGNLGGLLRMMGLATLYHQAKSDELHVDGVAVVSEMRGQGIGTRLFGLLESVALKNGIRSLHLDVIDTNKKAKTLYEQIGFAEVETRKIWPLHHFIDFPFRSTTSMIKKLATA